MIMQVVMWLLHSFLFDNQLLSSYMYLEVLRKINIQVAPQFSDDFSRIVEQLVRPIRTARALESIIQKAFLLSSSHLSISVRSLRVYVFSHYSSPGSTRTWIT